MAKTKTKSILPWYGSEAGIAKRLAKLLDGPSHCTIVFAGGLGILQHLTAKGIVANDKHDFAYNFYKTLKSPKTRADLIERCSQVLSHPTSITEAEVLLKSKSDVDRALAYWTILWVGRKGKGGTKQEGGNPSVRWKADGGNNASRIKSASADMDAWADLFRNVEFTKLDFRDVFESFRDDADCSIYNDPPWVKEGKYLHNFEEKDHRDLHACLDRLKNAPIVVRYGYDELIAELYPSESWDWTYAKSRTQSNDERGEVWITRRVSKTILNTAKSSSSSK